MARLEYIRHAFSHASLSDQGELLLEMEQKPPIERLPQIYWEDGRTWDEANLWALDRSASQDVQPETVCRTMKHLHRYANFIEQVKLDWRHFPIRKEKRVLGRFRKHLIKEIEQNWLKGTTASNCMAAVIQFYRYADFEDLVGNTRPMWQDRLAVIPYFDAAGFKRTIVRKSSDLKIPNRRRIGSVLEDGLLPLRAQHMAELLSYTAEKACQELHLMLSTGFFTGARVGTITTLKVSSLDTAREDPLTPDLYLLPVGPGTGIATKFSVSGSLIVPRQVLEELKEYSRSIPRLLRQAKAHQDHKGTLFLTRSGKPYTPESVSRLNFEMRRSAVRAGLKFVDNFKFHQSRATFGTWLMQLLLDCGIRTTDAIGFVRDAMLHRDERITMLYIKFLENTRGKQEIAAAFNEAFTGVSTRNWNESDA